jgi:tRNA G10  N-methylase Trm11
LTGSPHHIDLFDNVQFIYELELAHLELNALGATFQTGESLRDIQLLDIEDAASLKKRSAYISSLDGNLTNYNIINQHNQTRSVNQYLTHWFYPYKGKFHPQMIRACLNIMGVSEGDHVLDPFMGSGTTALESTLLGMNCTGFDMSPLCVLQSRVKSESIEILEEITAYRNDFVAQIDTDFDIHSAIENLDMDNEKTANFYKLALLIALSDLIRRKRKPSSTLEKTIDKMLLSVSDHKAVTKHLDLSLGKVHIEQGDARHLPLDDDSIDGVITSPPYSIALDYVSNDKHSLIAMGCDDLEAFRDQVIGVRGRGSDKIVRYNQDMQLCVEEIARVLKSGKFAVVVVGNAVFQGTTINTVDHLITCFSHCGLRLIRNNHKIIFGLYNVMQKENILFFQKGG